MGKQVQHVFANSLKKKNFELWEIADYQKKKPLIKALWTERVKM